MSRLRVCEKDSTAIWERCELNDLTHHPNFLGRPLHENCFYFLDSFRSASSVYLAIVHALLSPLDSNLFEMSF